MASQEFIDSLVDYYTNLLIVQYNNLPKANATIGLLVEEALANGVYWDVEKAYNILQIPQPVWDAPGQDWDEPGEFWDILPDIAVGKQLDIIGKYVGVDRFYSAIDLENYFALVPYADYPSSLPSSPPAFGCSNYANFQQYSYNGTLLYNDVITSQNQLSDSDFFTLIQFMIMCNNMNFSYANIDNALFQIFGTSLRAESAGHMQMTFFVMGVLTTLINTIIFKKYLPIPMGVGANIVTNIQQNMFGMTNYLGAFSPYASGFSTYADYATLPGQVLTYSQVSSLN